jgi:cystathionine beta-lyase/cystathionine gamma-synthase
MDTKWRTPNIRFAFGFEHVDDLLEDTDRTLAGV